MKSKRRIVFTTRTVVIFTLLLLVLNAVLGVFLMTRARASMRELIRERMLGVAKTAAAMLDGDTLASLRESDVGTPTHDALIKELDLFSENLDFEFIYIIRPAGDGKCVFIVDPDPDEPAAFGEEIVSSPALKSAANGEEEVDDVAVGDKWGKYYTAYCPVFTSKGEVGGIVGVDFDAERYEHQLTRNTEYFMLASVISLLAGGGIVLLMTARLRKNFARLSEETVSIAADIGTLLDEIHAESGYVAIAPEAELLSGVAEQTGGKFSADAAGLEKLSNDVKEIKLNLKRYITYVHAQAYTDGMTGVGNKTAYLQLVHDLNAKIEEGTANFSIAVFDINGLKTINDESGHEMGDGMINGTANCIKEVFGAKNVFRIGGDEFIAVLPDYTEEDMRKAFEKLDAEILRVNAEMPEETAVHVSFSKGSATFIPGKDHEFREVFRRADMTMYQNKGAYYKQFGDRRVNDD